MDERNVPALRAIDTTGGINQYTPSASVHHLSWWMEEAAKDVRYREPRVSGNGVILARLPSVEIVNRWGFRWWISPASAPIGGPVLSPDLTNAESGDVLHILRDLTAQIPKNISAYYSVNSDANNADLIWQAFEEAGFEAARKTTYVQPPGDPDVMRKLESRLNRNVRRADKNLDVDREVRAEEFITFRGESLRKKGVISNFPLEVLQNLIAEGLARKQVYVFVARKRKAGSPKVAAIVCIKDEYDKRYYLWMTSRDYSFRDKTDQDSIKVLIVHAMEHAQSLGLTFDANDFGTRGGIELFEKIFNLRKMGERNLFIRTTPLAGIIEEWREPVKQKLAYAWKPLGKLFR
jgi:hypothetical protein